MNSTVNMEMQGSNSEADILDLIVPQANQDPQSNMGPDQQLSQNDVTEGHLRAQGRKQWKSGPVVISVEEQKIRGELERDIETNLEEEIKDGICHLALRLHRLYEHQREKFAKESSTKGGQELSGMKSTALTEVTLTIRMEGGSKIEINETKKEAREGRRPLTCRSENKQGKPPTGAKEFDWVRSLRSGTCSVTIKKKHDTHAKLRRDDPEIKINRTLQNKDKRNHCTNASRPCGG